jgi:CRISPR-associated protein Cst2
VQFQEFPNAEKYADDFLFGYMVVNSNATKQSKRDSVLRMNLAVALTPYRFDATLHQSPLNAKSPWKNASGSALLHREVAHTAYQYPFALAGRDCLVGRGREWTLALLEAIGELSDVAGGHARSYYEMAPRSIVVRITPRLVAGFNTYGFDDQGNFPELNRILNGDLPGAEFWLGGELVRSLPAEHRQAFKANEVRLFDNPQALLEEAGKVFTEAV